MDLDSFRPICKTFQHDGNPKSSVNNKANHGCLSVGIRLRIFKGDTFNAHHRLETFPSNKPRWNGNILRMTCSNRWIGGSVN